MSDSSLVSLPNCISYKYNLKSKRAFAVPRLAHQFKLEWSWPAASPHPTNKTNALVHVKCEPVSDVLERGNGEGRDDTSPGEGLTCANSMLTSPLCTDGGIATDETLTHQFQGETTILSMSGDPHPTPHSVYGMRGPASQTFHLQRVALLLSAGYRFYIPLQALSTPEHHADTSSTTYWRTVLKLPKESPNADVPFCAEVVVGELAAIEWVASQRKGEGSQPASKPTADRTVKNKRGEIKTYWAPLHDAPAKLPVQSFFFHSIPYKLMWLSHAPSRLLVSLPCEERLVTLEVPHRPPSGGSGGYVVGQTKPISRQPLHAIQLPRGVVPLDMAEIYARPFLALGTYEHGVLIYSLDLSTGEVEHAVRQISIANSGSTIFPITKVAAVFPPPRSRLDHHHTARGTISPEFKWKKRAEQIASLADGVLFCCSALDPQPCIAKQLNLSDAIIENFSVGRLTEEVISVGSQIDPRVGVLFSTISQGLVRLVVYPDVGPTSARSSRVPSSNSSCGELSGGESSDGGKEQDVQKARRGHAYDRVLELLTWLRAHPSCSISERVPPFVCAMRSRGSTFAGVIRIAEGATVFEADGKYERKGKPLFGPSSKHWMPVVTVENMLLLLDRSLINYNVVSSFPLAPSSHGQKISKPHQTCEAGNSDAVKLEGSVDDKMGAPSGSTARQKRRLEAPESKPKEMMLPDEIEDLCTGVVSLSAGDEWLCVAAAHHRNWISILSYAGHPKSTNK